MAATIRDIKEQTGLSLATISKYINGGNVLPKNKIKIEKSIQELGYEVNEIARGLVTKKTRTVGVVVYDIGEVFNATLVHYIGDQLRREKYGMLICDSSNDEKTEAENIHFLVKKKVDGIIVIPISRKSDFLSPAINAEIPIVLLDRPLMDMQLDFVGINNRGSARAAVNVLIENNHKKIAIICPDAKNEYTGYERYKGYIDALTEADINITDEYIKSKEHSMEFGYIAMKELLSMKNIPSAVFMTNYDICLGAYMALNESQYNCPEDISLMGFDDLLISHVVNPRLRTVVQPMQKMGETAVDILLQHIDSDEKITPVNIFISTTISEGGSIRKL